jgi:hypothetical protein
MSISHGEVQRLLPAAARGYAVTAGEDGYLLRDGPRRVRVRLSPQGERAIGALRLPRTRVELEFENLSEAEIAAFLRRFDRAFQRGGG